MVMKKSFLTFSISLALLAALLSGACSGEGTTDPSTDGGGDAVVDSSTDGGGVDGGPGDSGASSDGATDSGTATDSGAATDSSAATDSATTVDAGPCAAGAAPRQCAFTAAEPTLCMENVAGCAGDTVEVDVFVLGPPGCGEFLQAGGGGDMAGFTVENPTDDSVPTGGRCVRRMTCDICSPRSLDWALLPGIATGAACADSYATGLVDTIQLGIPVGMAAGDYTLGATHGGVGSRSTACGAPPGDLIWTDNYLPPTIRVN